jgi:ribosome-associated toxin RatA of RatAB toxin-antitoxin module
MGKASLSIEIDVSPEAFRAVLDDYARYPEFLPEVKSVKVGARTPGRVEVTYRLDVLLKTFEYTLEHVLTSPPAPEGALRIDWKLLRGEFLRFNEGHWLLEPSSRGTRVTYSIDLRLGPGLPSTVETALAQQGLPRLLSSFKARAEQLKR